MRYLFQYKVAIIHGTTNYVLPDMILLRKIGLSIPLMVLCSTDLFSTPRPVSGAPNVSFMGLSSFYQVKTGQWLIGSFSGLYLWNRDAQAGAPRVLPIDKDITMVGFSNDFKDPILIRLFIKGQLIRKMPSQFKTLPMSLHMAALETHTDVYILF